MFDSLYHMGLAILSHPCPFLIQTSSNLFDAHAVHLDYLLENFPDCHDTMTAWCEQCPPMTHFIWKEGKVLEHNFVSCSFLMTCQLLLNQFCLPLELPGIFAMMGNKNSKNTSFVR